MKVGGIFALVVTVALSALVWIAVQDWYERRVKQNALAGGSTATPGPQPGNAV